MELIRVIHTAIAQYGLDREYRLVFAEGGPRGLPDKDKPVVQVFDSGKLIATVE